MFGIVVTFFFLISGSVFSYLGGSRENAFFSGCGICLLLLGFIFGIIVLV
jgi:hypothetical protein